MSSSISEIDNEIAITKKMNSYYGFRAVYVLLAWLVLYPIIIESTDQKTIFSTLLVFLLPFCFDYYNPIRASIKTSKRCEFTFWALVALVGFLIALIIVEFETFNIIEEIELIRIIIWISAGSLFFISVYDFNTMSTPEEIQLQDKLRKTADEVAITKKSISEKSNVEEKRVNIVPNKKKTRKKRKGR